jgi:hypothetical protein
MFHVMFPIGLTLAVDGSKAADGHVVRVLSEDEMVTVGVAQQRRTWMVRVVTNGWTS